MEPQASSLRSSRSAIKAIIITGLLAGTQDIVTAIIVSGATPIRVLHFVASGAFGRDVAVAGGLRMALLGLLFHYGIAFSWTILFFVLYPIVKLLQKNKIVVGLAYGIVVWLIMNLVVLPLSQIVPRPFDIKGVLIQASVLMVMIGLPISIMAHRFYSRSSAKGI